MPSLGPKKKKTHPVVARPLHHPLSQASAAADPSTTAAADAAAAATTTSTTPTLADIVRPDFPCLDQTVHGRPLIYLDSGATSQKPACVLEAMDAYYRRDNANVHRGVHVLAARATASYEGGRAKVAAFIGAAAPADIVLTRGATEAINLVAASWGGANLKAGDVILVSVAEHHANLVPWQLVAARTGARVVGVPLTPDKTAIDVGALHALLAEHAGRVKAVALVHMSNVLGSVLPNTAELGDAVRKAGAVLLLDACQSVPAIPVDVRTLGADFVVASAHKMAGPTGIGFLWGRPDLLAGMPPFMGGGEMIERVEVERSTFAPPPARFEPGTPPIAEAVGLGAAVDYLGGLGMARVAAWEAELGGVLWDEVRERRESGAARTERGRGAWMEGGGGRARFLLSPSPFSPSLLAPHTPPAPLHRRRHRVRPQPAHNPPPGRPRGLQRGRPARLGRGGAARLGGRGGAGGPPLRPTPARRPGGGRLRPGVALHLQHAGRDRGVWEAVAGGDPVFQGCGDVKEKGGVDGMEEKKVARHFFVSLARLSPARALSAETARARPPRTHPP